MTKRCTNRAPLTREFVKEIKCGPLRCYVIARIVGVHPTILSRWLNGAEWPRVDDERVEKIAKLLGFNGPLFVDGASAGTNTNVTDVAETNTAGRLHQGDAVSASTDGLRLLLRPAEAAEALMISRTKTYELIAAGVLPSIKVGASVRIPLAALQDWITGQFAAQTKDR